MPEKIPTPKFVSSQDNTVLYHLDETDNILTTGIVVDDAAYDTGSFLDRDYDVRQFSKIAIQLKNIGANEVKYTILSTTKHFDNLDADLADSDFTETEQAEAAIAAGAKSAVIDIVKTTPAITAIRLRAKETLAANPGTIQGSIKFAR